MIKYKDYYITFDGTYPVINKGAKAKSGKNKGELVLTPIYFPRDVQGTIEALYRIEGNKVAVDTTTLKGLVDRMKKLQQELIEEFKHKVLEKE